jgi:acyl-CoA synthetase (AMP-forming)/AMP-acid ligase II
MEWRLPNYASYDLKSLRAALYSGQAVDRPFLTRLKQMAPSIGGGFGLTEAAGLCTCTPLDWTIDEVLGSVGFNLPLCPMSIREPMAADGSAGREKPKGEVGEICFSGPQVFLGYMNDEAATTKTISSDGWCYTGDLGSIDERGVHLAGRARFVIKPKGYQVFPTEVENFITDAFKDRVLSTACVGVKHEVWTEAIVAFVEVRDGFAVGRDELEEKVKNIAAYKRPSHYIFVKQGEMPLNRVAKVDYLALTTTAEREIEKLRQEGKWDRGAVSFPS